MACSTWQTIAAIAPVSTGVPSTSVWSTPAKRSPVGAVANRSARSRCRRPSRLTPKAPCRVIEPRVRLCSASETRTSGGVSETEVKELAVHPVGRPSSVAVTTATPVAQRRMNRRSAGPVTTGVS